MIYGHSNSQFGKTKMAYWVIILLPMIILAGSRPANAINQTEVNRAMADMRAKSYNGFVILLNILNTIPYQLQHSEKVTLLMLDDYQLSLAALTRNNLQDFILRHAIPSGLTMNELTRLPNGTLIPSAFPDRMVRVINGRRLGMFLNKARIVTPNVCLGSTIRCHGISTEIRFSDGPIPRTMKPRVSRMRKWVESSGVANWNQTSQLLH